MYRDYENPRALEEQLVELKESKSRIIFRIHHLHQGDCLSDLEEMLFDLCNDISDLEQRINFAWQDEEFG